MSLPTNFVELVPSAVPSRGPGRHVGFWVCRAFAARLPTAGSRPSTSTGDELELGRTRYDKMGRAEHISSLYARLDVRCVYDSEM